MNSEAHGTRSHIGDTIFVNVVNIHAYLSTMGRIEFPEKLCIYMYVTVTRIRAR